MLDHGCLMNVTSVYFRSWLLNEHDVSKITFMYINVRDTIY